ncbi:MAG: tRNA (adenosine(37)-N6)-dimethylallyltransferase MiaA [Treponemataceae bacterium]|nr:tRNA (adenosine(37)-N6)-dimethylallyltransferase MiaA [Treponemataceae bacterium]
MELSDYTSENGKYNCIVLLGPTACGKTGLGVQIADYFCQNGIEAHIISADSRQVYRGLDIGSGKDLCEFTLDKGLATERSIKYHMIDIADVNEEYNVFKYQQDFYKVFESLLKENVLPVIVGGTGLYIDAIIRGYRMLDVPTNIELRKELQSKSEEELIEILKNYKAKNNKALHNSTDITEHHRLIRAIEIEVYRANHEGKKCFFDENDEEKPPVQIKPLILGTTFDRSVVRKRVSIRLSQRLEEGMIEEVQSIHDKGASWDRLERLGLEYKFVSLYLQGKIESKDELYRQLEIAIHQFVKRQETWFRGMERKGVKINWLPKDETRFEKALEIIKK